MRPHEAPFGWLPGAHGESDWKVKFRLVAGSVAQNLGSALKLPPPSVPQRLSPSELPNRSVHESVVAAQAAPSLQAMMVLLTDRDPEIPPTGVFWTYSPTA